MSNPRRIITRPTAGSSANLIRPYRIVENNLKMPDTGPAACANGIYRVTPAWQGNILYGSANLYMISTIEFTVGWSQNWGYDDPGFDATVYIDPPTGAHGHQAAAHASFGFNEYDFFTLLDIYMTDGGWGYERLPNVRIDYNPNDRGRHFDFQLRPHIAAVGVTMSTCDHPLKVGDECLLRWKTRNDDLTKWYPDAYWCRFRAVVSSVSGAAVEFSGGFPQPMMKPGDDGYYLPGDPYGGITGASQFGGASRFPEWRDPHPYDDKKCNPYINQPPWTISIYRYDPRPVWFYQDPEGGPLRLGDYVAVHEGYCVNGLRVCWPMNGLTRTPYWGQ